MMYQREVRDKLLNDDSFDGRVFARWPTSLILSAALTAHAATTQWEEEFQGVVGISYLEEEGSVNVLTLR
jgi:hypothetical protein